MNDLDWKQPALIGGVIGGILSVIPGISLINCCFCAWLLFGGAIAAKLLINRTPRPVKSGEGAQVGAIAGLIAAGIYFFISLALIVFSVGLGFQQKMFERIAERYNDPQFREMLQKIIEANANQTPGQRLIASLPVLIALSVLYVGFSTLGGLLGVALFEKRRDQPPPQQYPPGYPPGSPPNYPPNYPPPSGGPGGNQGGWPQA